MATMPQPITMKRSRFPRPTVIFTNSLKRFRRKNLRL